MCVYVDGGGVGTEEMASRKSRQWWESWEQMLYTSESKRKKKWGDKQRNGIMENGLGKRKMVILWRVKEKKINIKYNI